jgi:metal-responsive CopG/Arc/MetJ family transcriptional regulator
MSITVPQKKRGRPATGEAPHITLRLPAELLERVELYGLANGIPRRSEAIRRLVEGGLTAPKPTALSKHDEVAAGARAAIARLGPEDEN